MKYLLFMFILSIFTYGEPASKDDIKLIIEQMDKRFEQVDKRFEIMQSNMDRRFEQVDKRFETVFDLIYILMGLVFASPFIAVYLRDKKEAENKKYIEVVQGMLATFRELAKDDEKIAKSLRNAHLL